MISNKMKQKTEVKCLNCKRKLDLDKDVTYTVPNSNIINKYYLCERCFKIVSKLVK